MNEISKYDQLLYSIGRATQAHVNMERSLRNIHITLTAPSLGVYLASSVKGASKLIDESVLMLKKSDMSKEIIDAGVKALTSTKDADEQRHRLVHDWWINKLDPETKEYKLEQNKVIKGSLNGFKATTRDLSYVKNVIRKLVRSYHRINALDHILREELPFYKSSGLRSPIPLKFWIEIVDDNFKVNQDGSIQVNQK